MKRRIRLTERDLNRIVKNTINELTYTGPTYTGGWPQDKGAQVNNYINDQMGKIVRGMMQLCQRYINNNDETALSQLSWLCSSFSETYNNAWKNGQQIYGGMKFPQQQPQQQQPQQQMNMQQ